MEIDFSHIPLISSRRNSIVRRLKKLCTTKGRNESAIILLEGTHLLQEILNKGRIPLEIVATEEWINKNHNLLNFLSRDVAMTKVSQEVLQASLSTVNPDGVACLISFSDLPKSVDRPNYILALDRIQDPGNLGTIFRNALAAEIELVWLGLGADPLGQKSLRASAGAILELPFQRFGSCSEDQAIDELSKKLKDFAQNGYQVIGSYAQIASTSFDIVPYWEVDWMKPTVLVLGNEGNGLHSLIQACCTKGVTLPHSKTVESLNVASASVPLLLERTRSKMTTFIN